ncbi:MAG TPA: UrcA family protein [Steroidobacteraceae bacterium]|nr:UrcA family protein [Steroidobacteraceae bacterium]
MTSTKTTLAMLICGIVGAAGIGAASAATSEDDVPAVTVKYDPTTLQTDGGARRLYERLANAAAEVCPQDVSSPHFVTRQMSACRAQAIARAVMKINSPRLVAVFNSSVKNG